MGNCSGCSKGLDCIVKDIESQFGVEIDSYTHKEVDFSDGSLGLPKPGYMYPQVIVPGYKILADIKDDGKKLFHTTLDGGTILENPNPKQF